VLHANVEHGATCVSGGHALPSLAMLTVILRLCVLLPPPHGLVQSEVSVHAVTSQSTDEKDRKL
jgi:hypothetical protein